MMTGNIQGYDDITNQRLSENNYKFSWNQEMMEDLDKTITDLNGEEPDQDQDTEGKVVEKLVSLVPETLDIYDGGDERRRPSSMYSKIVDTDITSEDDTGDKSDGRTSKNEL